MQKNDVLNEAQKRATEHIEGALLVMAGAGSGKTRVVTERIAHLLKMGVPAQEILAVTFTNKAAGEMQRRIQSVTNQFVLTSTFHSLGARILRESIHEIGYQNTFTIYDENDSENLLKHCFELMGIKDVRSLLKSTRKEISEAKNSLQGSPNQVFDLYQSKLKEYNALDFDDLLYLTVELFKKSPEARRYQERWSFILVDEYQDTNTAQYWMVKFLSETHKNLFVVGDPDQSIYSWRGANVQNILNFERDFPGAKTIMLDQNYRSTNMILKAANAVIDHNQRPHKKALWSQLGDGEKLTIQVFATDKEEAHYVAKSIQKYMQKVPPTEIVIFYRTNSQSRIFEDQLLKFRIPYVIVGGLSFYERREIKDLLAYLRLMVCPTDYMALARTINVPKRGIGPATLKKLNSLQVIRENGKSSLQDYLSIIDNGTQMVREGSPVSAILRDLIVRSRYIEYLKEDKETYDDRKENVEELVSKAVEWEKEAEVPTLLAFLEELTLKSSLDEVGDKDKCIRLMTLHNSKGLEFDVVHIVGIEEDLFPHINAKETNEGLEEERRLCYVGMTRAKKHLHLSLAKYRILWGFPRYQRPSRFLNEIPKEFATFGETREERGSLNDEAQEEESLEGKTVVHKNFGRGIIRKAYQTSLGATYDVYFFQDKMVRSLVAKFAKLETVL